jgi:lipopolysaccharide export LptBFGC system permease protein LptF
VFTAGEVASERGFVPAWIGVWAANAGVAGLAVYLIRATMRGES